MNRPFWGTTIYGSPHKASLWSNSHQFFHLILPRNSQHLGLCFQEGKGALLGESHGLQKQQWWIDGACFKECSPISKWTVSDEPMSDCIGSLAFGNCQPVPFSWWDPCIDAQKMIQKPLSQIPLSESTPPAFCAPRGLRWSEPAWFVCGAKTKQGFLIIFLNQITHF